MDKKTLFFDIDGTLLGTWHNKPFTIPRSNWRALLELKQQGHEVIACTGRHEAFIQKRFPGIFESHITMNGTHVVYKGKTIYDHTFTQEEVRRLMEHFDSVKAQYAFVGKTCAWCRNMSRSSIRYFNHVYGIKNFAKTEWEANEVKANSLEFMFDTEEEFERCKTAFEGTMVINRHLGSQSGDLAFMNNDKGNAIKILTEYANISLNDTIAFGDGNNDISMLKIVNCGIAMGNGTESAKQAADMITDSVFENGIYKALVKLHLLQPPMPQNENDIRKTID